MAQALLPCLLEAGCKQACACLEPIHKRSSGEVPYFMLLCQMLMTSMRFEVWNNLQHFTQSALCISTLKAWGSESQSLGVIETGRI